MTAHVTALRGRIALAVARLGLAVLFAAVLAGDGRASPAQARTEPPRPSLPRGADPNDWHAYFDYGASILRTKPGQANAAFYWSSRLDPSRAEPLFARRVAFWLLDLGRFERYLREEPRILESAPVRWADSLYLRALHRNPFVPQTLAIIPYDELPGEWAGDLGTLAFIAYARLDYAHAAELWGRQIRKDPERYAWTRYLRVLALVPLDRFDSASAEMTALGNTLRARTEAITSPVYESQEMIEYGIGMLQLVLGNQAAGREHFERALQENLAFFPAHEQLGQLALDRRDSARAVAEYVQAAELAPGEPWIQFATGTALLQVGRYAEAVVRLEQAIQLEPLYSDAHLALAQALAGAGDSTGALHSVDEYLRLAPRRVTDGIATARRLREALTVGPSQH